MGSTAVQSPPLCLSKRPLRARHCARNCICTISFPSPSNPLKEELLFPDGDTKALSSSETCPRSSDLSASGRA